MFIIRWAVFGVLWWGLSQGGTEQWPLSIFFISAAALLSIIMVPAQHMSLTGFLRFIPFYIFKSVMGGLDVAGRALRPSMPLKTGFIDYPLKLEHNTARVVFVWVVSLLPGTAGISLREKELRIHVIDEDLLHEQQLNSLERHLADMFKC